VKAPLPIPRFEDHAFHAEVAWKAALAATSPGAIPSRVWRGFLPRSFNPKRLKVLAIGKASIEMTDALLARLAKMPLLRRVPIEGLVTCVPARLTRQVRARLASRNIRALLADHPLPTSRNVRAARAVAAFLDACEKDDTLLVLLSGGGSAHLALPIEGLSLDELTALSSDLMKSGATIHELNCVRKHLEQLKGGRAAARCGAGKIRVAVLSDVIGDPLDVISSGPFAPDPTTFAQALAIVRKRRLATRHTSATKVLMAGVEGTLPETPKPGDRSIARVKHTIVLSNQSAMIAAASALRDLGFDLASFSFDVEGESASVAQEWLRDELRVKEAPPIISILGGETTVTVGSARGLGGPSQEFALAGARALARARSARAATPVRRALLTFSTDGVDGPTNAAGAIVTDETWREIARAGVDPEAALKDHDSHRALDRVGALIRTGPTGTNVNHIAVLLVYPARA
jgi:glycerate 2-kinase